MENIQYMKLKCKVSYLTAKKIDNSETLLKRKGGKQL